MITGLFLFLFQILQGNSPESSNVLHANPLEGARWNGHAFPGAVVPHGMISLSPRTDFNHPVGYSDSDKEILGFGTMHLHGTLSPSFGGLVISPSPSKVAGKKKSNEIAEPGYYSVELKESGIFCEMTAGTRSGMFHFRYPEKGALSLQITLNRLLGNELVGGYVQIVNDTLLIGYQSGTQISGAPAPYNLFFAVQFNNRVRMTDTNGPMPIDENGKIISGKSGAFTVTVSPVQTTVNVIEIRVAHSFVSLENALDNLKTELGGKSFDDLRKEARIRWESQLNRIQVTGGNEHARQTFYTALYHSLLTPFTFSDVNGEYFRSVKAGTGLTPDVHYSGILTEDSWMTLYPLISLIYPEKIPVLQQSVMRTAEALAWMPLAEIAGRETYLVNGDPTAFFMTDAWFRNFRSVNAEQLMINLAKPALDTLRRNPVRPFLIPYFRNGFIAAGFAGDNQELPVSLNYSIADHMLHRMADSLEKPMLSGLFKSRSGKIFNLFSSDQNQFVIPGTKVSPFDQSKSGAMSWYFPPDPFAVVQRIGGEKEVIKGLIRKYRTKNLDGWDPVDRWYLMVMNEFEKDAWRAHQILREFTYPMSSENFTGYPAADWGGRYSGVILSTMMGLYPSVVQKTGFYLTPPVFDSVKIFPEGNFSSDPVLTILAKNQSRENYFIKSVTVNQKQIDGYFLNQSLFTGGLTISLEMNPRVVRQLME